MFVETLESRRMLSGSISFVNGVLSINYSSDTGHTLNVLEGQTITPAFGIPTAGPTVPAPGAAINGNVLVFDSDSLGLDTAVDQSVPNGFYQGVTSIVINGGKTDDNINFASSSIAAQINGNDGNDQIVVNDGLKTNPDPNIAAAIATTVHGGAGNDVLTFLGGDHTAVYGDTGADTLNVAGTGSAILADAGNGTDTVNVTPDATLTNCTIVGGNGSDTLNISVASSLTNCSISGGNGSDTIIATA